MTENTVFPTTSSGKKTETERERFIREMNSSKTLSELHLVKKPVDFHQHGDLRTMYHRALIRVIENHLNAIRDPEMLEKTRDYLMKNRVYTNRVRVRIEQIELRMKFGRR